MRRTMVGVSTQLKESMPGFETSMRRTLLVQQQHSSDRDDYKDDYNGNFWTSRELCSKHLLKVLPCATKIPHMLLRTADFRFF
jgi:hypothetical protein